MSKSLWGFFSKDTTYLKATEKLDLYEAIIPENVEKRMLIWALIFHKWSAKTSLSKEICYVTNM